MWLTPGELGDHWTDDLLTSKLWVTIGPILFSSGTIESFYSVPATSRWPHIIIATFFVSFYLVVNFWFVCYCIIGIYLLPRQDIFGIVSSWRTNLPGRTEGGMVRGNTESSHYYGDYNAAAVQVVRGCYYSNSVQPPTTQTHQLTEGCSCLSCKEKASACDIFSNPDYILNIFIQLKSIGIK